MKGKSKFGFAVPPVFKFLLRGYIIMAFILALYYFGAVKSTSLTIFLVTIISISMVFGVGFLLLIESRPVRASSVSIPETVLFFVKGSLILYFVSLLAEFGLVPQNIVSIFIFLISITMVCGGAASFIYEVMERVRPVKPIKAQHAVRKGIRTRTVPFSRSLAARGRSS